MIKELLKKSKLVVKLHNSYKKRKKTRTKYKFIDRSTSKNTLCYILAGYKPFTWDEVFDRIKKYAPKDIDICILSSGVWSDELNKIAEQNNWSYLSTKRNNVSVAQNLLFKIFNNVQKFYKIDEDIFITKYFFEELNKVYEASKKDLFVPGIICPLIPVNGFGHVEILKRFGALDEYSKRFEPVKYMHGSNRMIENNVDVAKFMWGEDGTIPKLDVMCEILKKDPFEYVICPIRFSIGAIMFDKHTVEALNGFDVGGRGSALGVDEGQLCGLCVSHSLVMMVSKNTVVGHLSFGSQNKEMAEYYKLNKDKMFS